jgi:hypothetical protein
MRLKPSVVFGYLVLLLSSLGIPAIHYHLADRAIEHTRMGTGFLPAQFLFWRWAGQLAWIFPVVIIVFFVFSLRREPLAQTSTLLFLATVQLVFVTLYGVYCAFLLSHLLLAQVG